MLEAGPPPGEEIAAYNGPILRERIEQRFGKLYSLNGVYKLLHPPGLQRPDATPASPGHRPGGTGGF
jgi:hypothetical protein